MRPIGRICALLGLVTALFATPAAALTPEEQALVAQVNAYLNDTRHLQGSFLQIDPDGTVSEGTFYLRRPGRLRFEYNPPSPLLVVSDGTWVLVQEDGFGPPSRYPLGATPLSVLLADEVDIGGDAHITEAVQLPGTLKVTLTDDEESPSGELTVLFDSPEMQLRQWTITDAQGLKTTVALSNIRAGIEAENSLFVMRQGVERDER